VQRIAERIAMGWCQRGVQRSSLPPQGNDSLPTKGALYCSTRSLTRAALRGICSAQRLSIATILLLIVTSFGCQARQRDPWNGRRVSGSVRAIWVTRWDFKSPRDIAVVMENCRQAGFNTVLFQVRGAGTAFYRSRIEPWADELGGSDPGFDPLEVAINEARRRGLSLHAWVNVLPAWHGDKPPRNPRQLYHAKPEWFWYDASGRRQPLGWYCSLNPCLPEVRHYLVSVMHEIVSRYPVDGLHLDYIRFPNEYTKAYAPSTTVPDYPRDARTVGMFQRATGRTPDQAPGQWNAWRAEQVSQLVRDIRAMMLKTRPGASLTVAVSADPDAALRQYFQDSRRWMAEGWVDAVFPMNYESDMGGYSARLANWTGSRPRVPVVTGIMFDQRSAPLVKQQVDRATGTGSHFAAFAYNSLFERLDTNGRPIVDAQSDQRAALRREVIPYLRSMSRR
jgi:uncharacterized lipoprotein YddW (UPF0748 family)